MQLAPERYKDLENYTTNHLPVANRHREKVHARLNKQKFVTLVKICI
jgi:hypothetical protein